MRTGSILALAMGSALLAGMSDPPATLVVGGDRTFDATIQGAPARLRIDPGGPTSPVLNLDFAMRARLKASIFGILAQIGPVRVPGWTGVVRIDFGKGEFKRRGGWFERPFVSGADAAIGPGGVPMEMVRFELAPPQPGERTITLPLADFGRAGMGATVMAGAQPIAVRFSMERDRSVATAAAGAAIAEAQGGSFDRPPERMLLHFGVERPARHVALARPLGIGPLSLGGLMVRTSDFGSTADIPDPEAQDDPDEITVTGRKKVRLEYRLEVGRDHLSACSSIVFDKRARTVTLACR